MKTITVNGELTQSRIHVGESIKDLNRYLPTNRLIIITDENVKRLHGDKFPDAPIITMGTGKKTKTLATCEMIYDRFIRHQADRTTFILGIGGGIVCDITGFVASTYMRGLPFGFVSTTLLSQVDASVGGKNGVNFQGYKNMVGLFRQPEFVICDTELLKTLPRREISNGLAEIVKHGLIYDPATLSYIEDNRNKVLALDHGVITRLVTDSVTIKARVVTADEKEAGERRKLNFGHTIGHALESILQEGHGRAVSLGMVAAARFSRMRGLISRTDEKRIIRLLSDLNLPVTHGVAPEKISAAMTMDKKREQDSIHFVFLTAIGSCRVESVKLSEVNKFIHG